MPAATAKRALPSPASQGAWEESWGAAALLLTQSALRALTIHRPGRPARMLHHFREELPRTTHRTPDVAAGCLG